MHWLETSRGSGVILVAALLCLWQFSALYIMDTPTWPPVTRIFGAWYDNVVDGTLIKHLLATLWRQMLGYSLAVLVGIGLGLAIGYYRALYNLLEPLIEILRPIPGPAYLPVLVLFVGIGHEMKVVLIMVASLFPILLNTYGGVRSIDPVQLDTARTLGLTTMQTLREVVLPAASPQILTGMRISLADLADSGHLVGDDRVQRRAWLLHAAGGAHLQGSGHVRRHLHAGDVRIRAQSRCSLLDRIDADPLASRKQRSNLARRRLL